MTPVLLSSKPGVYEPETARVASTSSDTRRTLGRFRAVRYALWTALYIVSTIALAFALFVALVLIKVFILGDSECDKGSGCTWFGDLMTDHFTLVMAGCIAVSALTIWITRPFRR
jgi:hypothetical protein